MPYKERDINKMYYTSCMKWTEMFNVNVSQIRFGWKGIRTYFNPKKKNKKGKLFIHLLEDIENLKNGFQFVDEEGYT